MNELSYAVQTEILCPTILTKSMFVSFRKTGLKLLFTGPDVQQTFKGHVLNAPFVMPFRERYIVGTRTWWPEQC